MVDSFNIAASFFRTAGAHAHRLCYSDSTRDVTYGEMGDTVGRLAALLSRNGRPRRVGILATRSYEAYVGMLAAGLAGAAYVPINQKWPEQRIVALLEMLGLDALVTDANGARLLTPAVLGAAPKTVIVPDEAQLIAAPTGQSIVRLRDIADAPLPSPVQVAADDLAYIIFTSGTTGMPKGVMISAGSLRNYIEESRPWTNLVAEDRLAETHDITFDLTVHNLFLCMEAGASLHVLSALDLMAPGRFVRAREITVWMSVPTLVAMMRRNGALKPAVFPSLRLSIFCGEPLPVAAAQAWAAAAPNSVVENAYGPAEATVICLRQQLTNPPRVTPDRGIVAIGTPYASMEAAVLGADDRPVRDGVPGELALSGPQLAVGYLNATEDQASRFREIDGRRWYLTGDLAMRDADGTFHHLGRTDNQVKVKGNRIELEEVEAHLRRAAGSEVVAVVAWPVVDGSAQGLVGFFHMRPGNEWMTTLFMRRIMKDSSVEYIDITASEAMRRVIRHLGFVDRTSGMVIIPNMIAALQPARGARIVPLSQLSADQMDEDHLRLLRQHERFRALSVAVEMAGVHHPLILMQGRRKRLGSARIVLARDRALIQAAAGPLSRYLLKQGIAFLEFDSPSRVPIPGAAFVTRAAPVQTTWPVETAAIDHTFSELMFIPPPNKRPFFAWPRRRSNSAFPFPFGLVDASITAAPSTSLILSLAETLPV